jgi:Right handed beta helix region
MAGNGRYGRTAAAAVAVVAILALGVASAGAASGALYVSASGGSDLNPCTSAAPCKTIGHAVAIAGSGQTVVVEAGTYHETVTVTKSLSLVGQDATVDASQLINGIVISGPGAAGTVLRGFTVENAIGEGVLAVSTSNLTLQDNHVLANDKGHDTPVTPECATNGQVPGDCGEGLHLMSVTDSRVVSNDIENNIGGILVTDEVGPSRGNLIAFNVSRNNGEDCGITLPSHNPNAVADPSAGGVYDNTVLDNLSVGNGGAGVGMFAPFPGAASYGNRVIGNALLDNGEAGIAIHSHAPGQNVAHNVIIANAVSGNGIDPDSGSGHPTGIALFSAADATSVVVAANQISNEYWGVFIAGPVTVFGLQSNFFSRSVTNPIGHP